MWKSGWPEGGCDVPAPDSSAGIVGFFSNSTSNINEDWTLEASMPGIMTAYLITFGWALVGSLSMGIGIIITLKLFDLSTTNVDEWELVKEGNIPIAIILAAVIISLGLVVSSAIHP